MDSFVGLGVMLIAVFELIGIMWVYGVNRFCDNIEFMNNFKPSLFFKVCWVLIAPVMLAVSWWNMYLPWYTEYSYTHK